MMGVLTQPVRKTSTLTPTPTSRPRSHHRYTLICEEPLWRPPVGGLDVIVLHLDPGLAVPHAVLVAGGSSQRLGLPAAESDPEPRHREPAGRCPVRLRSGSRGASADRAGKACTRAPDLATQPARPMRSLREVFALVAAFRLSHPGGGLLERGLEVRCRRTDSGRGDLRGRA